MGTVFRARNQNAGSGTRGESTARGAGMRPTSFKGQWVYCIAPWIKWAAPSISLEQTEGNRSRKRFFSRATRQHGVQGDHLDGYAASHRAVAKLKEVGTLFLVIASGLKAGEAVSLRMDNQEVASGTADAGGNVALRASLWRLIQSAANTPCSCMKRESQDLVLIGQQSFKVNLTLQISAQIDAKIHRLRSLRFGGRLYWVK